MADCYECKHRGRVVGSSHSRCCHPVNEKILSDPLVNLIAMLSGGPIVELRSHMLLCGTEVNPHGWEKGWGNWPFDFDPIWITCHDLFESKNDEP